MGSPPVAVRGDKGAAASESQQPSANGLREIYHKFERFTYLLFCATRMLCVCHGPTSTYCTDMHGPLSAPH